MSLHFPLLSLIFDTASLLLFACGYSNQTALLHFLRSQGSQFHDDFPSVAECAVGQGEASFSILLLIAALAYGVT